MKAKIISIVPFFFAIASTLILMYGCEKKEDNLITDIDGNKYHTVTIGDQVWMVENLRTTRYSNGETILEVMDANQWTKLTSEACCYYHDYNYIILENHDTYQTITTYGRLYNWYAVTDSRKIAPEGWHVATADDWNTLINYAGGKDVAAGKLKEAGTKHWNTQDDNATNEYGFTALPGGSCNHRGSYEFISTHGNWWTASASDENLAYAYSIYCFMDGWEWNRSLKSGILGPLDYYKTSGLSVRCVKD
jgi:uncharacterized protein (TIGR02145 family)